MCIASKSSRLHLPRSLYFVCPFELHLAHIVFKYLLNGRARVLTKYPDDWNLTANTVSFSTFQEIVNTYLAI